MSSFHSSFRARCLSSTTVASLLPCFSSSSVSRASSFGGRSSDAIRSTV